MLKRPHYIALSVVAVVALVLLNLPSHTTNRLKLAIGGLFLPLFGLASSAQKLGESAGMRALPKSTLINEVETLRRENAELRLRLMQTEEIARENAVLREAVEWQARLPWDARLARVISRDPANWWRTIQINLGSKAGVVKNLPVVTDRGLVGRVDEVGINISRVVLIGDPSCRVAVVVDNEDRSTGVVLPGETSVLDESIVQLKYLSRHGNVQPGQRVLTSGLAPAGMKPIFPKGIPVGTIIDTNSVAYGLEIEARIKLAADLQELEEVWVLFP